ncbi:unnamed protein product [Adineta steineri]|uniref:Uncharacterized protein n=1 Tax=Adineta steineri TaxID=433720 RepID=A0A814GD78_9BILA|nr:unnamed protein product [Adineta steineri]
MEQIFENDNIELSIYNDGSSASDFLLSEILERFLGMGYGKYRAVQYSSGRFLYFQDAFLLLVGSKYERIPEESTDRYTQYIIIFCLFIIGGRLYRVNEILLYHPEATKFSVHE